MITFSSSTYTTQVTDASGVIPEVSAIEQRIHDTDNEDYEQSWCYCNQPSYGTMIGCDNDACTIEWFHMDCLRIRCPPKGKWHCPSCRKLPQFLQSKKGKEIKHYH